MEPAMMQTLGSIGGAGILAVVLYTLFARQRDDTIKERETARQVQLAQAAAYREDSAKDREVFRQECGALRNLFAAEQCADRELYRSETQKERDVAANGYAKISQQLNEIQSLQVRVFNRHSKREEGQ